MHLSFLLKASLSEVFDRLFSQDPSGKLRFGHGAKSRSSLTQADLSADFHEFREYIMEGFVSYQLKIEATPTGSRLRVGLMGSNRDAYVKSHILFHLKQAGLAFEAEEV